MSPRARVLALSCLVFVGALACTTPCREGASANDWHAFEHDQERCELQTSRLAAGVDPGDYRACMRARGWCSAPETDGGAGARPASRPLAPIALLSAGAAPRVRIEIDVLLRARHAGLTSRWCARRRRRFARTDRHGAPRSSHPSGVPPHRAGLPQRAVTRRASCSWAAVTRTLNPHDLVDLVDEIARAVGDELEAQRLAP